MKRGNSLGYKDDFKIGKEVPMAVVNHLGELFIKLCSKRVLAGATFPRRMPRLTKPRSKGMLSYTASKHAVIGMSRSAGKSRVEMTWDSN